ncbi:MAG TPA: hypothetical protein PK299_14235 [Anaerolineales bacterium]|nr:hypothetical protein [Anaerolineales bacterium]
MLKSIFAILLGFLLIYILVGIWSAAYNAILIGAGMNISEAMQDLSTTSIIVDAMGALLAAFCGGWVTANVAGKNAFAHAAILAGILFMLGIVSAILQPNPQMVWYGWLLPFLGVVGVLLGGKSATRTRS